MVCSVVAPSTFNVVSKSVAPFTLRVVCSVVAPSTFNVESKSTDPVAWRVPVISKVDVGLLF